MIKKGINLFLLIIFSNLLLAQEDTIQIDEIYVNSSRIPVLYSENSRLLTVISKEEIQLAPVQNIQDILKYVAGVDIRERGAEGVQADISIRGGSFEQTLILLNGVKINDPQTGHHNLNIPVDIESIERIEILEGPAARIYGQNAFSGAINIITNTEKVSNIKLNGFYGNDNLHKISVAANLSTDKLNQHLSFSTKSSDGYIENTDFLATSIFYNAKINSKYGYFNLQAGYLDKKFGANSFYTPKYPDQYEEVNSSMASLKYVLGTNKLKFTSAYFWRRNNDYFVIVRTKPEIYQNYHQTDVLGSEYTLIYNSSLGKTALSFEYRKEHIYSNSLGDEMGDSILVRGRDAYYYNDYNRNVTSLSLNHSYTLDKLTLAGGLIANWNNDFGLGYYPGIDFSYKLSSNLKLIASVNTSFRTVSFTEMFYVGLNVMGNRDLKPEEVISYEVGMKYSKDIFKAQLIGFYNDGKNIVDWIKPLDNAEASWQAQNIPNLNTSGLEVSFSLSPKEKNKNAFIHRTKLAYSYLNKDLEFSEQFDSQYALDYVKHKMTASLQHNLVENIYVSWQFVLQDREGGYVELATNNFINYDFFSTVSAKISWKTKFALIYFDVNNLFNVKYYDFGNIQMPGRWIKLGAKLTLFENR